MNEYVGMEYLKNKLSSKRGRVLTRYKFYDMKNVAPGFGIADPPEMRFYSACLGWCSKAVDALADRLVFRDFSNDMFNINAIYNTNNPDVLFDSAILSALISSCCFIYISPGEDGAPRLQVIDGGNATGVIDPITGLLKEGYAVLKRDEETKAPTIEAYFLPNSTEYYYKESSEPGIFDHAAGYPLLVPIIHRADAVRPFGHSRITRACISLEESALRTLKRAEISSEFYSFPQKYILGLSEDAEPLDKWRATLSSMMVFTKDEDGDTPKVGQFTQQSMAPYLDELKTLASLFAGETGLTLDDLGFATENPSSAEAIKATHENLRMSARKAQRSFGSGFLNAGFVAACLRDNFPYERKETFTTCARWEPIFEPDAAALSGIGDGAIKINQAVPGYFDADTLRELTGIKNTETNVKTGGELTQLELDALFGGLNGRI